WISDSALDAVAVRTELPAAVLEQEKMSGAGRIYSEPDRSARELRHSCGIPVPRKLRERGSLQGREPGHARRDQADGNPRAPRSFPGGCSADAQRARAVSALQAKFERMNAGEQRVGVPRSADLVVDLKNGVRASRLESKAPPPVLGHQKPPAHYRGCARRQKAISRSRDKPRPRMPSRRQRRCVDSPG